MSLSEARQYLANTIADWEGVRLSDLQFWHRGDGRLFVLVSRSARLRPPVAGEQFVSQFQNMDLKTRKVANIRRARS